ncbi:MAG: histidine--tRNA ligase [Candidatus Gracilibacteria bacterium]|nr:histidine--tRNA ligase [Candidatus Gracilibacteria bacterium]
MNIRIDNISGFPENLPEEQIVEDRYKDIIRKNYLKAGFNSIETSLVEREEVLCSKGGDDNEIYGLHRLNGEVSDDSKLGLRFDLTVPLARYVALNNDKLVYPFKRFQIQKVYRGERAQKGRYREFYQADIDIIGNGDLPLLADCEIISTIYNTLKELDFGKFTININHKDFLIGFLEKLGILEDKLLKVISVIDKKDKLDNDKQKFPKTKDLLMELLGDEKKVSQIIKFILLGNKGSLAEIEKFVLSDNESRFQDGFKKLKEVYNFLLSLGVPKIYIKINPSISRGLNYYTGIVFETFIDGFESFGSVSSGGRYDNLTGNFIKNKYPGVGGSIGLSRLLSVIGATSKLNYQIKTLTDVLVLNIDEKYLKKCLEVVKKLRKAGINTEFYLEHSKISKQIKYAENKGIRYVLILGEDEINRGVIAMKDMFVREQKEIDILSVAKIIKKEMKS